MSLLVTGIRLPFDEPETAALDRARRLTGLLSSETEAAVCRVSIDARRGQISRVYSVRLDVPCDEKAFAEKLQMPSVRYKENARPAVPHGEKRLAHRPVVVGLGPAGLFAAYTLARHGFRPIVLERGGDMDERDRAVDTFWSGGALDPDCNIQFGEGGAGAYSDGKLTTRIGDALCETVLETLAAHGAPADIVKKAKPHVGTDILKDVVREMRREIVKNGGEVHFRTALTGVSLKNGALTAVRADGMDIPCERAVIAVGHSARDTFLALHENGVYFEPKAFSVGVRIEHLQSELDRALYGKFAGHPLLPPGARRNDRAQIRQNHQSRFDRRRLRAAGVGGLRSLQRRRNRLQQDDCDGGRGAWSHRQLRFAGHDRRGVGGEPGNLAGTLRHRGRCCRGDRFSGLSRSGLHHRLQLYGGRRPGGRSEKRFME